MFVSQLGNLVRLHDYADFHPALGYHRAPPLLFRRQPPQLNCPASNVPVVVEKLTSNMSASNTTGEQHRNTRVVSQRPLHGYQSNRFKGSHLSCARKPMVQCQPTVKLHRVFSSYRDSPGIFTWSAISPGLASRQRPHRDTIRAGRNFKGWFPPMVNRRPERKGSGAHTSTLSSSACFTGRRISATSYRYEDRTISSSV